MTESNNSRAPLASGQANATAPNGQTVQLSKDSALRLAATRQAAAAFGDVVSLLARSPRYKHHSLADLEWLAVPPIALGQFEVAEGIDPASGARAPLAAVLWANVSDDLDQKLRGIAGQPHRLRPEEWRSGGHAWMLVAAGDPRAMQGVLVNLSNGRFKETTLWIEQRDASGNPVVTSLNDLLATAGKTPALGDAQTKT